MKRRLGLAIGSLCVLSSLVPACGSDGTSSSTTSSSSGAGGGGGTAVSITVTPPAADVLTCTTEPLTATVTGTTNTAVTWKVEGDAKHGSVDEKGLYTAPIQVPAPADATVTATSEADPTRSASSKLTLWTALPQAPSLPGGDYDSAISHHQIAASGSDVYAVQVIRDDTKAPPTYALQVVASHDGGKTFGAPVSATDIADATITLYSPSIAIDAGDPKTVYVAYAADAGPSDKTSTLPAPMTGHTVALAVSTDAGKTFTSYVLASLDYGSEWPDVTSPAAGVVTVESETPDGSGSLYTYVDTSKGAGFAKGTGDNFSYYTDEHFITTQPPLTHPAFDGGSHGIEAPRIFSDGNHGVCITFVRVNNAGPDSLAVQCSTDDGKTFADATEIEAEPDGVTFHHPIGVFGDGEITVAYWSEAAGEMSQLHVAHQKKGQAFTTGVVPSYASKDAPLPLGAAYPAIAWDGGTLWMAYLAPDGSGPNRLVVDKSCDGGTTWSGAQLVNGPEPSIAIDYQWPGLLMVNGKITAFSQRHVDSVSNDAYDLIQLVP